jgi:type IV fimbrial biogenesis protein FimT
MRAGAGFTFVELAVTLLIVSILVGIAMPSLRDAMFNARMVAMVNDTMADLNIARSEAVKRNTTMSICASTDGATCAGNNWKFGWIVFQDPDLNGTRTVGTEELIKASPALENTNPSALIVDRLGTPTGVISYGPSGLVSGVTPIQFTFCDMRAGTGSGVNNARRVTINSTGRPVHTRHTCAAP